MTHSLFSRSFVVLGALATSGALTLVGCGASGNGDVSGVDASDPGDIGDIGEVGDVGDPGDASGTDAAADVPISADGGSDGTPSDAPDVAVDALCPVVTAVDDVDPWSMRPASAGFGAITEASTGAHRDVFLDSPTKYIRVGSRLDWGGTVVFFGLVASPTSNVIDANDTGRELQVALYDPTRAHQPCAATATCTSAPSSCGNSITYLGWDPVQGGDECGHGAPVLSHGRVGDALELVLQPLQWNPDWDKADCTSSACGATGRPVDVSYRMRLRFVREHVVEVDTEVTSKEALTHPVTAQEFPTLYVANGAGGNPDLPLLLDASGGAPAITTPANDGFTYGNFTSSAPWVTWQNATKDYGVGLAMDQGITDFQGWKGDGSKAPYFHNVRAQMSFGLGAGGVVRGMSYLALGSFGTVKSELEAAAAARGPFGHVDEPSGPVVVAKGTPVHVRGWALDNRGVTSVEVQIDGVVVGTAKIDGARADVCAVYPMYPGCPTGGFALDVATTGLGACPHLLRVTAKDADGHAQILGERALTPK